MFKCPFNISNDFKEIFFFKEHSVLQNIQISVVCVCELKFCAQHQKIPLGFIFFFRKYLKLCGSLDASVLGLLKTAWRSFSWSSHNAASLIWEEGIYWLVAWKSPLSHPWQIVKVRVRESVSSRVMHISCMIPLLLLEYTASDIMSIDL